MVDVSFIFSLPSLCLENYGLAREQCLSWLVVSSGFEAHGQLFPALMEGTKSKTQTVEIQEACEKDVQRRASNYSNYSI